MKNSSQATLRSKAKAKRLALTPLQQQLAAKRLCQKVIALPEFKRATYISIYFAMFGEIQTDTITATALSRKKKVYLPAIQPNSKRLRFHPLKHKAKLKHNHFGIPESIQGKNIAIHKLSLVLMPLVAFDKKGNRIGMGGGYYDFSFQHLNKKSFRKTKLIGLAHRCQQVDEILPQSWDIKADLIISA